MFLAGETKVLSIFSGIVSIIGLLLLADELTLLG
jgi:hypothetical protein